MVETLNGLETIKATGSSGLMRKRFEEASNKQSDLGLRNCIFINSICTIHQLQFNSLLKLLSSFVRFLIADGTVTMGALIAAVILCGRTLAPLTQLANALTKVTLARTAFQVLMT